MRRHRGIKNALTVDMTAAVLLLLVQHAAAQLVGPGGMTPYAGGGGGGPRYGGTVRISEPVLGFVLAGSRLDDLNGVYGPRLSDQDVAQLLPVEIAQTIGHGAYRHHGSGWLLAHVTSHTNGPQVQEWVLFDPTHRERFAMASTSLIPSSGKEWSHLHRESRAPPPASEEASASSSSTSSSSTSSPGGGGGGGGGSTAMRASSGDDDDELPWSVVGIRDYQRLDELRQRAMRRAARWESAEQRRTAYLAGVPAPAPPSLQDMVPPEDTDDSLSEAAAADAEAGRAAYEGGDFATAAARYEQAAAAAQLWASASLQLRRARALRRAGELKEAGRAMQAVLEWYPNYIDALYESAFISLDARSPAPAINHLARIHNLASWDDRVGAWLKMAYSQRERMKHEARHEESRRQMESMARPRALPRGCEVVEVGAYQVEEHLAAPRRARHHAAALAAAGAALSGGDGSAAAPAADGAEAMDDGKEACCLSAEEVRCPEAVDRTNWYDEAMMPSHVLDRFAVEHNGTRLKVRRVDENADAAGGGYRAGAQTQD